MPEEQNTLDLLAEQLLLAIEPLAVGFSHPDATRYLLAEMGWDFNAIPAALTALQAPAEQAYELINNDQDPDQSDIENIIQAVNQVYYAIDSLKSQGSLPNDFRDEFPPQLVQYLIVEYLLNHQPGIGYLLSTLGLIRLEEVPPQGNRLSYLKREFAFADFGDFFNDPLVFFKNAYHWGQSDFKGVRLLQNVYWLMNSWGLRAYEEVLPLDVVNQLTQGALQPEEAFGSALRVAFIEDSVDVLRFNIGFSLFLLPETANRKPGFALLPFASGEFDEFFGITENLELGFEGGLDLTGGLGILVRPNRDIELLKGFGAGNPSSVSGHLLFVLRLSNPDEPFLLLGKREGSRMELAGVSSKIGTRLSSTGKFEILSEFALEQGKIVVKPDPEDTDGFLAKILPPEGITLNFDLGVGFSSTHGFYFVGGSGLEILLPVHIDLGVLEIQGALISMRAESGSGSKPFSMPVDLAATFKVNFGVLTAVVENLGLRNRFAFPDDNNGNLGPVDLALGLRPPNGVGLAVDAGIVKGGGYLFFDFDREEYAGALELVFSEWIALKAIGLITTRLPDGSKGFSMIIIVTVEFGSGIQLGFGFTLLGVGGLLGLNRTVNIEPLALGVRTGSIESVMFPQNVIANAPKIISDLRQFFPPEKDQFLIGPMAKIGYGTPTLISLSLGVIIEFPKVTITILGVLKAALPTEQAAVLKLQVNFIGRIEPANKLLWFYAELFDSRILFITLEGGMGLLVNWSSNANFVFTVGGFHPRYNPPPLPFPEPPRLAISILNQSFARIRVEGYFAVTSNSVQFGARAELYFGFSALNVDGHLSFDVLFQFNPFFFIFEFSAGLSVKVFGFGLFSISVSGMLEGPSKWHIKGKAKWKITWIGPTIKINIDETWGEEKQTVLPPISILPLVEQEYAAITNWEAVVPNESNLLVTLRKLGETEEAPPDQNETDDRPLVLHPLGKIRVSQRKMPLELKLEKFGNQQPDDVDKLTISANIGGGGDLATKDTKEQFARGEYKKLDNSQKLSSPGFEFYESGLEIKPTGDQLRTSMAVKRIIRYEQIIIDNNFKRRRIRFFQIMYTFLLQVYGVLFAHLLKGSAITQSPLSKHYQKQLKPNEQIITVQPNVYSVAFIENNVPIDGSASQFTSEAQAMDYMNSQAKLNPKAADLMHVIPNTEVNHAA